MINVNNYLMTVNFKQKKWIYYNLIMIKLYQILMIKNPKLMPKIGRFFNQKMNMKFVLMILNYKMNMLLLLLIFMKILQDFGTNYMKENQI